MRSETPLQRRIQEALQDQGWWTMKIHGGGYQPSGLPDILAIKGGLVMWIEVKVDGEDPTKIQERQMMILEEAGATVGVARSVDDALWLASICMSKR